MKINRQFQDQHLDSPTVDWVLKQQIERDICLLYHQLADYSYIMGDLYYGDVFALPIGTTSTSKDSTPTNYHSSEMGVLS